MNTDRATGICHRINYLDCNEMSRFKHHKIDDAFTYFQSLPRYFHSDPRLEGYQEAE